MSGGNAAGEAPGEQFAECGAAGDRVGQEASDALVVACDCEDDQVTPGRRVQIRDEPRIGSARYERCFQALN
jgi:hypothetical protein